MFPAVLVLLVFFVVLWAIPMNDTTTATSSPKMTLEEYINNDAQCDKPYDMTTKHGRAVANLCNYSKDTGLKPADIVTLELALYKGGHAGVSPYTQELIDRSSSIRAMLRSRDR
jgi:hypothetical protein